ncbi:MAG TPA: HAMP domain-containing sensor histidine kinase [Coriobacteriia bacterium]|jgi:signal transduction histidine kinase
MRTTLAAVAVVTVSLAVAAVALVGAARASLTSQITSAASMRAEDVATLVKTNHLPSPISGRDESLLVQVVDGGGRVVASSASIEGQGPLVPLSSADATPRTFTAPRLQGGADESGGEDGDPSTSRFVVAVRGTDAKTGRMTVIVAASLAPVEQLAGVLTPLLGAGLPLVMLVIGATVWALTGRALLPIEAITTEAETISAAALEKRLPVPDTGDEVAHLAQTMNGMLDRLESAAVRQRQFVADASHELKSPVAAIGMMLDVAESDGERVDRRVLLGDLRAEDERLAALVTDLVTLACADENAVGLRVTDVDLDDVVIAELAVLRSTTDCAFDLAGLRPVRIRADRARLAQLTRNLLENAARHAGSRVRVSTRAEGDEAVLTVSDDGTGIAEADRERVFERFVRLDEGRSRSDGGTGLGLAVCRAIARAHGGEIRVADTSETGTTFEVRLPLSPPPAR